MFTTQPRFTNTVLEGQQALLRPKWLLIFSFHERLDRIEINSTMFCFSEPFPNQLRKPLIATYIPYNDPKIIMHNPE